MASLPDTRQACQAAPKVALGVSMTGATVFAAGADRGHPWILGLGIILLVGAMVLGASAWVVVEVRRVNRPADDAFTEGYEAGFDRGWRDRDADARPNLVLLPSAVVSTESADSCDQEVQLTAESASHR